MRESLRSEEEKFEEKCLRLYKSYLQTCIVVSLMLAIVYTNFRSHSSYHYTDTYDAIIMYCLGYLLLFTVNNDVYK